MAAGADICAALGYSADPSVCSGILGVLASATVNVGVAPTGVSADVAVCLQLGLPLDSTQCSSIQSILPTGSIPTITAGPATTGSGGLLNPIVGPILTGVESLVDTLLGTGK